MFVFKKDKYDYDIINIPHEGEFLIDYHPKGYVIANFKQLKQENEKLKAQLQQFETQPVNENARKYNCDTCLDTQVKAADMIVEGGFAEVGVRCWDCKTERKPQAELEYILKFRLGDRVAVHPEGRDTFRGTIFNIMHNKIYVIEDGFYSGHDDNPFLPSQCRKLKRVKGKPYKCPVCDGKGKTQVHYPIAGIYVIATPSCTSCKGTGALWENK